jgi:uncharacterized membrane protein
VGNTVKKLRTNLIVGLILMTPVVLTFMIVNWLFTLVVNTPPAKMLTVYLRKTLPVGLVESGYIDLLLQALVFVLVLLAVAVLGFVVRSLLGRKLYNLADRVIARIPFISRIYIFIRQISESLVTQRDNLFKEVVLIEYPRKGLYSMAFVTAKVPAEFKKRFGDDREGEFVALFVPTTPNPTSGFLIFAPRADTIPLKLDMTDAMKLVFSAGALYPGDEVSDIKPSNLLERLESLMTREAARKRIVVKGAAPPEDTPPPGEGG